MTRVFLVICAVFAWAAPLRAAGGLGFVCSAENDLYVAIRAGGTDAPRFELADRAVDAADEGSAVLILAEGYPSTRTTLPAKVLEQAAAKKLRLYVEYPDSFPGVELGTPATAKWERVVVASDALGAKSLPSMRILTLHEAQYLPVAAQNASLVLAREAGFDKAVYGLPKEHFAVLFEPKPGVFVATTKLSDFVRSRYAPTAAWVDVWQSLLAKLDPAGAPHKLVCEPTVRPAYAKEAALPQDAERTAAAKFAGWILNSHLLNPVQREEELRKLQASGHTIIDPPAKDEPLGDGSIGIGEGYGSNIVPGGGQKRQVAVRADCQTESAAVLAIHALLDNDARSAAVAKNLLDFTYFKSGMCQGDRGNPKHPAYGLIAWGDNNWAWGIANYGDDNARTLLATMLAAACLKSDAWDEAILKGLLANLRTTGQLGFRTDRIDMPDLAKNGWRHYHDSKPVNMALNFEAYPWACFIWAYHQTGQREFLDKAKSAIRITMEGYPDKWRWGDNMERARMLLPLAWLLRVEDTPEHREWLMRIANDLIAIQDPCGALPERLKGTGGGHYVIPASNEAYGTSETPLIQENGDPVSDQLYTVGFALFGLHEAAAVTGDAKLQTAANRLSEYLVRIQVRSAAHPYLDGTWFRAFDFGKWDFWASSADLGWGAWSAEAGWCQTWSAITLGLRAKNTSFWELTEQSRIEDRLPEVQKLMSMNDGQPFKSE